MKKLLLLAFLIPTICFCQTEKIDTTTVELSAFEQETLNGIAEAKKNLEVQFNKLNEMETLTYQLIADRNKIPVDKVRHAKHNGKKLELIHAK